MFGWKRPFWWKQALERKRALAMMEKIETIACDEEIVSVLTFSLKRQFARKLSVGDWGFAVERVSEMKLLHTTHIPETTGM